MAETQDPGARGAELHEHAIALREAGAFGEAETACREAVEIFATVEGPDSPNLANTLIDHSRVLESLDRLDEAGDAVDRALAILRPLVKNVIRRGNPRPGASGDDAGAAPPDSDSDSLVDDELVRLTVRAESTRGSTLRGRGRLSDAEEGCQRALALAEAWLPPHDLLIAETLNALAVVHKFQGRYADAEPLYRRALVMVEAHGQADAAATLLHNLGGLAHARGDFATGEPLARRSVELRATALGEDHPTTAADRAAWGALLEGQGRFEEAERAYAEALMVFETRLGVDSLEAASALTAIGSVQHARGALDDAERSYRRSLEVRERKLGTRHFDVGLTLNNLGMLRFERGAPDEAAALLTRAQKIFVEALGPEHPHTRAIAQNIATLTRKP